MPTVHPTAILEGDVELADDVLIGPHCVLCGPVRLGPGCRLVGHVYVHGPAEIGAENLIYPFACIGFAPQHLRYDPTHPGHGVRMGDRNTLREHVTVHRAFADEGPTTIGSRNYLMNSAHVGHDARVGDECTLVSAALLGGHSEVQDWAIIGGGSGVHQFARVGRGALLGGVIAQTSDLPPFFTGSGPNLCIGPNLIGMRRRQFDRDQIDDVRWVFNTLYRSGLSLSSAKDRLRERDERPLVAEYIRFLDTAKRPISDTRAKTARGAV